MSRISRIAALVAAAAAAVVAVAPPAPASNQQPAAAAPFTLEQVLAPAYPFDLVAARGADRIAWIAYERGMRNVWTAAAPDFEPQRLTANLEDDGVDLSSLRISNDGSVVVFVRGHTPNRDGWIANPASDPRGAERAIWAARTAGGAPWKVAVGANPALSPDGRWVLYVRDRQIHRAAVDPGLARRVDAADDRPLFIAYGNNRDPVWSPDGRKIAYVSDRGDHSFIGIYDVERPEVSYLAPGVDNDTSPTWSPDGTRVAFIRRPGDSFAQIVSGGRGGRGGRGFQGPPAQGRGDVAEVEGLRRSRFAGGYNVSIWVADVASAEGHEIWHNQPNDEAFEDIRGIQWAADSIVFQAEPGNWRHIYSVPAAGHQGDPIELTPGDGLAEHTALSADGRWLFYSINVGDIDRRHLWRVPTSGGEATQVTRGATIETYPAVLASGSTVAVLHATARRPQSVAIVRSAGTASSAGGAAATPEVIFPELTEEFPLDRQVEPEAVTLTAEDGFEFYNQLFLPADLRPGERRPALIFIHGGSRRQMLLGYHYMHFYHMAYAVNQYFAGKGYVVMSVNYRSGIGYGKEFREAPERGRGGNAEYQDILAAGLYLRSRDDVDPERIGLWGLSYGGILTAQGLARNSDVFAAGVDMAGVHLWGDSLDPEDVSYKSSAIAAIDKWTSPVLLIHGDDDRNVEFSQTVGLVQLLRAHQLPFELIVFPDDVHDFLLHERWLISFNATDEFFERRLLGREMTEG